MRAIRLDVINVNHLFRTIISHVWQYDDKGSEMTILLLFNEITITMNTDPWSIVFQSTAAARMVYESGHTIIYYFDLA